MDISKLIQSFTDLFSFKTLSINKELLDQIQIIYEKGGIMMIPLTVCSFIVLLVTFERLLMLRQGRVLPKKILKEWDEWFKNQMKPANVPQKNRASLVGSIFHSLVSYLPLNQSRYEERITDLARKEKHRLERGLVFLDTIAGIAPLFGLLGTALGMVEVFSRLSVAGEAKMSALSAGISQALFTTVTGLCIGIPSLIAYNLFSRHIEKLLIIAEEQINQLTDKYYSSIIKQ